MAVTGKEYVEKVLEVYNMTPKAGYIWGTSGKKWTQADQTALVNKYNRDPGKYADLELGAKYGSKWIGHNVWDCSGLTSERAKKLGLTYHHGSNSSYLYDCQHKGEITKGLKLPKGAWVYTGTKNMKPHIGVVVDDEYVVEAQGTKNGVVKSKITLSKWKYWGLGKGMIFDFIPGIDQKPSTPDMQAAEPTKKMPTLKRGARGEDVRTLQTILAKAGSSLAIDGIFGPGTQSAVRTFQKNHHLVVDGIVGPKTWAELLKV